jgi:hypothetical protein
MRAAQTPLYADIRWNDFIRVQPVQIIDAASEAASVRLACVQCTWRSRAHYGATGNRDGTPMSVTAAGPPERILLGCRSHSRLATRFGHSESQPEPQSNAYVAGHRMPLPHLRQTDSGLESPAPRSCPD